ncbi:SMI1/KNR4 family protein [Kitasatospora sp. NPDC057198]|uniref:SMI1/KNR4 family protein n=1 Tax=Kitasatospora sp. NPDC057198 TaxID=3346046 RepID=UPI00364417DF
MDRPRPFWDPDRPAAPPLTEPDRLAAERLLGVTLPAVLLDLLREQDGGLVADGYGAFPTDRPTSWAPDHVPFDHLHGAGRHPQSPFSLLDGPYLAAEWGLPDGLVPVSGDGHHWIALDYRRCGPTGEPAVAWYDAEAATELPLAPDFAAFLHGLTSPAAFEPTAFEPGAFEPDAFEPNATEPAIAEPAAGEG